VSAVPDEAHAQGLEVCAHAWITTEPLLRFVLGDDAPRVWRWLASLPFVVRSPLGLRPHELARDVLRAEHVRRAPGSHVRINHLLHRYGRDSVRHATPAEAHIAAIQLLYLHRDSPLTKAFWEIRDSESVSVLPGRPSDHHAVLDLVERCEGADAADLARRWLDAQGPALRVVRGEGRLVAFALEPIVPHDGMLETDDPVARSLLDEVARVAPLRPGERMSIGRFFGGPAGYQVDPHAVMCGSVSSLMTWQTQVLAWSWIVTLEPEFWTPMFDYLGFDQRFTIPDDGRVAFGFDWRRIGLTAWLDVMGDRELSGETGPMPRELLRPPPLDRRTFDAAVREALRSLTRPDELADNPLIGSQLVDRPGPGAVAALAEVLRAAATSVAGAPGGDELHRVLDRTFLRPAPSQEAAAEVLDLSFSTYRRRVAKAVDAMTDVLWAVELGERSLSSD
jgi:hypothetical protein